VGRLEWDRLEWGLSGTDGLEWDRLEWGLSGTDGLEWDRLEWDRRNVPFQISRCRKAKVKVLGCARKAPLRKSRFELSDPRW